MKYETLAEQFVYYDELAREMREGPCADCKAPGPQFRFDFCEPCWKTRVAKATADREARNVERQLRADRLNDETIEAARGELRDREIESGAADEELAGEPAARFDEVPF